MKHISLYILGAALLAFCFCVQKRAGRIEKPLVFVSIVPQKYFVDKISGGLDSCLVMVPPGTNAHSYEPRPAQMSLLSKAKAYFAVGLEFEGPWLPKFGALSPALRIVHTDSGVKKIPMEIPDSRGAVRHADQGESGLDPHIWLSPELVKQQVASITIALKSLDTAHAEVYENNSSAFVREIDSLELKLRRILPCDSANQSSNKRAFLVFHPTWGYFARDFCLKQIAIESEGKEPGPRTMKALLDAARQYRIRTVFVQPEFSRKSAEVIAHEIGASVVDADALSYDWPNTLLTVAQRIAGQ
ncbi:MAG TPA: zinc ABC transporter substrate-binding protein [Chitinivibrionales bacterium]|nr:zinc ABC transporter substrate-binding protein [Chitinivibrionales bacterium]